MQNNSRHYSVRVMPAVLFCKEGKKENAVYMPKTTDKPEYKIFENSDGIIGITNLLFGGNAVWKPLRQCF